MRPLMLALLGFGVLIASTAGGFAMAGAARQGDLAVTKSDRPDPVDVGALLTYTLRAENRGPDTATGVIVTDKLPSGVDFVSVAPRNCRQKARKVTCNVATLASGATATVKIKVRPKKAGTITDTASVESNVADPVTANNEDTETTTVTSPPPPPGRPTCAGRRVTILGTSGSDTIIGTAGHDVIAARRGDDVIKARDGRDVICLGPGIDRAAGDLKADTIKGGAGRDTLRGRRGDDTVRGGGGRDHLFGGRGADLLDGRRGFDSCVGGRGTDVLRSCEA
jgi:uncharacterized repeat protein (TIGR01451 family)